MSKRIEVRAFQITKITGHGAACSDDFDGNWARELHSSGSRYAIIPAEAYNAFEPVVGSWVVEHASGRLVFPSDESFRRDYEWVEDDRYVTSWEPLFGTPVGVSPYPVPKSVPSYVPASQNPLDKSFSDYMNALTAIPLTTMIIRKIRGLGLR